MNIKELIEILQKMPADLEVMLPLESNLDRVRSVYIATVAESQCNWEMAPVGNFVTLDNDELSQHEDIIENPFQIVVLDAER